MRKTKKLVALVLAMVFVVAFMAMSASAATIEVQPRATCPRCGGYGFVTDTETSERMISDQILGCPNFPTYHAHYEVTVDFYRHCATCGYYEEDSYSYTRCPYGPV